MKPLFTQELLEEMQKAKAKEWREFWQENEKKKEENTE